MSHLNAFRPIESSYSMIWMTAVWLYISRLLRGKVNMLIDKKIVKYYFLFEKTICTVFAQPYWTKTECHTSWRALSSHLTNLCGSPSKQSKDSASNINIWSKSSSCLSKYSQREGKVASSQASCCVYYFSVWPLTCRQKTLNIENSRLTSVLIAATREMENKQEKNLGVGGLKLQSWCISYIVRYHMFNKVAL